MPRLSPDEHLKRKDSTRQIYVDKNGKPLNEESKSVAVQDKKDICDINRIVKKAIRPDGQVDMSVVGPLSKGPGIFGDFTNVVDFQTMQNRVIKMNNAFMALDPVLRAKFDNDPAKLIAFISDENNKEEAIELGFLPKPKFETKSLETPEGKFWVTTKDGVEIKREAAKLPPAPGA